MERTTERREQLIGAAVAGELTDDERVELDAWCADDPEVARELTEMLELVGRLDDAQVRWVDVEPSADLGARIEQATTPRRPRRLVLVAAAALLLLTGAAIGVGVERTVEHQAAPTGPPGTLGAVEHVAATTELAGATVDLSLVAHTWGTETVMELDGFTPGEEYAVVLLDRGGREVDSGTFIGSTVTIDCRMNAALLREDVSAVEILEADGTIVVEAPVPAVGT